MQQDQPVEDQQWQPCQGEISDLGAGLRRHRRTQTMQRRAALTAGVIAFAFAGFFVFGNRPQLEPSYGGIVCSRVQSLAEAYVAGELDDQTTEKVRLHLEQCGPCRGQIEQMLQSALTRQRSDGERKSGATLDLPAVDQGQWLVAASRY